MMFFVFQLRGSGIIFCHPFGVLSVFPSFIYNHGIPSGFSIAPTTTSPNPYKISPKGRGRNLDPITSDLKEI